MDPLVLIIALFGSNFIIIMTMLIMMLWIRSEANVDRREFQKKLIELHERKMK